jgi:hypothetical protein
MRSRCHAVPESHQCCVRNFAFAQLGFFVLIYNTIGSAPRILLNFFLEAHRGVSPFFVDAFDLKRKGEKIGTSSMMWTASGRDQFCHRSDIHAFGGMCAAMSNA